MKKCLFSLMLLSLIIQIVSCEAKDNENRAIENNPTPEIVKVSRAIRLSCSGKGNITPMELFRQMV
jgi:hypothetical protein